MIDRERLLASDHEARLHAEARLRRLATGAARSARDQRSAMDRTRRALGQWLIGTGRQLDATPDTCGPAEARPA